MDTTRPSQNHSVTWKDFPSLGDYAKFALSAEAPRYSAILEPGREDAMTATFGVKPGGALFSDDLEQLQRAALRWDENGYEVYIDRGADHPEYPGCEDSWAIRAGPQIPESYLDYVFLGSTVPPLEALVGEVERLALSDLCSAEVENPLHIIDKMETSTALNPSLLTEIAEDPREYAGWGVVGAATV